LVLKDKWMPKLEKIPDSAKVQFSEIYRFDVNFMADNIQIFGRVHSGIS